MFVDRDGERGARRRLSVGLFGKKPAPGVFVIDGRINPALEADWHAEHFPS